jgi:hypothetical protein
MAMKGMKQTLFKSVGWFLVLIGLMLGIYSCYQYYAAGSGYGFAFGVLFVTIVITVILLSIDLPNLKVKKISIKTIKNLIFVLLLVIDVLFLVFQSDGTFSVHALILFIGMVLTAIVLKLERDFIEKRKKQLGLVFLAVEIVLILIIVLVIPDNGMYYLFLIYGIGGMVGWDTLQSIFWKQKLRSIIFLGISIVLGWIYGIIMVAGLFLWTNLLGPIFVLLGLFLVLYIEWQMRKKKLLVYIK